MERLTTGRQGFFLVTRTSSLNYEVPPVEGAVLCETRVIDRRSVDDPKKIPINNGTDGDWWDRGENHRIENGCICRDLGWRKNWFIDVPDVMKFVEQYGPCVVSIDSNGYESIEIYDDYRE